MTLLAVRLAASCAAKDRLGAVVVALRARAAAGDKEW